MPEKQDIVYRFTPQFKGAFLKGAPKRDLTQRDVDRMDPLLRRDAFGPHPLYGTPLYTAVGDDGQPPKWFQDKQAKAAEGEVIEPMLPNETKAAYEARVDLIEMEKDAARQVEEFARLEAAVNGPSEDGDA